MGTNIKEIAEKLVRAVGDAAGVDIEIRKKFKVVASDKLRVNIGAGSWGCNGWINLDYPSESYSHAQSKHPFIPYDIRNDKLPFDNNIVDIAYCSHVIEHIENQYISELFAECYRTLKPGGGITNHMSRC